MRAHAYSGKLPNLELKNWPKQPLGAILRAFALPIGPVTTSIPSILQKELHDYIML